MFKPVPKEIKDEILQKVKDGQKVSELASVYGIRSRTIYQWLARSVVPQTTLVEYNRLKRENEELKKIIGIMALDLQLEKKESYIWLSNNKKLLSHLLGINRKKIYYHSIKDPKDQFIKNQINSLLLIHPSYGHKRIALALSISPNKARRIMKNLASNPQEEKLNLTGSQNPSTTTATPTSLKA